MLAFQLLNFSNGSTEDVDNQGTPNGSRTLCLPLLEANVNVGVGAPTYLQTATPNAAASARLVLETLTWFARHRRSDPHGAAIPPELAQETAVDALLHAFVPPVYLPATAIPPTRDPERP